MRQTTRENGDTPAPIVREANAADLPALLALYAHLHPAPEPLPPARAEAVWRQVIADPAHRVLLVEDGATEGNPVAASCVLLVVPNLSHGGRPYALIENVVTHPAHRRRGFALAALQRAHEIAIMENCYKLMLLTGAKHPGAPALYEKAGFNSTDKTAFVQWLE